MGDWLTRVLIFMYVAVAVVSAFSGELPKMVYWIGCAILTIGVLFMR